MKRSIRTTWVLLLLLFAIVPVLLVGGVVIWQSYEVQQQQSLAVQHEIAERAVASFSNFVDQSIGEAEIVARTPDLLQAPRSFQEQVLAEALSKRSLFDVLTLVGANGIELAEVSRVGVTSAQQLSSRAGDPLYIKVKARNRPEYAGVRTSPVNGELLLLMAVPITPTGSEIPAGVLIGEARLGRVIERIVNIPVGIGGSVAVLASDMQVLAHRNAELVRTYLSAGLPQAGYGEQAGLTGAEVLLTYRQIEMGDQFIVILVELPLSEALAPAYRNIAVMIGLLSICVVAAVVVSIQAARAIAQPIQGLESATQAISGGDLTRLVPVTNQDEIGALQEHFNRMVIHLREQRTAIAERTAALEASLDAQRQLFQTIEDLSTPLLPIWQDVVVLPLVGHMDSRRGQAMMQAVLGGVVERRAQIVILDITGVAVVDSQVVDLLMRTMQAAILLGAQPMLAGISPTNARMIVEQGIVLEGIQTYRDLRSAMEAALLIVQQHPDERQSVRPNAGSFTH